MKSSFYVILFALLNLGLASEVKAQLQDQKGIPFLQHFDKIDYLAGSQNWDIDQDSSGLFYIANDNGLLVYDGRTWICKPVINKTIVRSIFVDQESGKIYTGAQGEFGFFHADDTGDLQYKSLTHLIPDEAKGFEDIWDIQSTSEGLFLYCYSYIFRIKGDQVDFTTTDQQYLYMGRIQDQIYVQELGVGLKTWKNGALQLIPQGKYFEDNLITSMIRHPLTSSTIISTLKDGLYQKNEDQIEPWDISSTPFFKEFWANRMTITADKNIVVGTYHNGIVLLNPNGDIIQLINVDKGLANNTIGCLYTSPLGGIWAGMNNGLTYLNFNSPASIIYPSASNPKKTYSTAIFKGYLYVATSNGLYRQSWSKNRNNGAVNVDFEFVENTEGQCWSLNIIDDALFLGHHEGAFQIQDIRATPILGSSGAWEISAVPKRTDILIESTYKGLFILHKINNSWVRRNSLAGFDKSTRFLEFENDHTLWITHGYKGAYRIKLNKNYKEITEVDFYGADDGFPSNIGIRVFNIYNKLIFTGERGIYSFDSNENKFKPYEEWLPFIDGNSEVDRLFDDDNNNVWFLKDNQIGYLKRKGAQYEEIILPEAQGHLVENFENIYIYDQQNTLIGTESGILHYNPAKHSSLIIPYLRINQITLNEEYVLYGGYENFKKNKYGNAQAEKKIASKYRDINFAFGAIRFPTSKDVLYSYKLDGYDSEWSHWGTKNQKEYTNLNSGSYTFNIKARLNQKESDIRSFAFSISPRWFETILAKVLYVLAVLFIIYLLITIPVERYRKAELRIKKEKDDAINKKEALLKIKEEQATRELVQLKNNNLQSQIEQTQNQLASTTMHLVQNGDNLLRIKEKIKSIVKEKEITLQKKELQKLVRSIDANIDLDKNWSQFSHYFDRVHGDYIKRLQNKFSNLSSKDLKLCAYLKMNLSTKEIAPLLNISVRGIEISRYRLRKKLELERQVKLTEYLMAF